jgi:hypothetical protein
MPRWTPHYSRPEFCAALSRSGRAAKLRCFPYVVYHRYEAGTVYILAVLHNGGDPQQWLRRA